MDRSAGGWLGVVVPLDQEADFYHWAIKPHVARGAMLNNRTVD